MLTQRPKRLPTLKLAELEIPGKSREPLPSGEWGINIAAAQSNFPDHGLQVYCPPWNEMNAGDRCLLLLNDNQVSQTALDGDDVDKRVTLFVESRHLRTGSYTLSYRVERRFGNSETMTPPIRIYVKLEAPGGKDQDGDVPGHSELHMTIDPKIIQGGVDSETAAEGVDIAITAKSGNPDDAPYPNIAEGDRVTLSWGGVLLTSTPVTAAQISDPGSNPITIHVDEQTILDAKDSGPDGLAVTFMIRDIVNNRSEDWCAETRIVVDTGNSRLEAPIVDRAVGNTLDLASLGDEPVLLKVWATPPDFELDDVVIMNIRGVTLTGEVVNSSVRKTIEKQPPLVEEVQLPNAAARELAKTQAVFSYQLERNGEEIQRSKGRFVNIVGDPIRLRAPTVEGVDGGALDPDLPGTRVIVPFDEIMAEGQVIEIKWFGVLPDNAPYDPEIAWYVLTHDDIEAKTDIPIQIDAAHIKKLEGGKLDVYYNLLSEENNVIVTRESFHHAPLNIGEPQFELVKPIVLGENNGSLEPDELPNGTGRLTVPRPVTNVSKAGDIVTYTWTGSESGVKSDSITLTSLTANRDVPFTLNSAFVAAHIEPNRGGTVTATYKIWRAAENKFSYSNPLIMTIGEAPGALLPPAKVLQAQDGILDPADTPNGATVQIDANRAENAGDHFYMRWQSSDGSVNHVQDKPVTSNNKGKPVEFTVPLSTVLNSRNKTITVSYRVELFEGGEELGKDYQLRVEQEDVNLPVPSIREAKGAQNDQLNPDDVYPAGATVVIGASAQLKTDDEVIVQWVGKTTLPYSHTVLPNQADKELAVIKIPYAVVNANDGESVVLMYTIKRKTGATDGPSAPAVYDVRKVIGSGQLKVMGARFNRSTYRASGTSRVLSAFNAVTGQPLQAEWQYQGDDGWQTAAAWRDTAPHKPLRVRTADDLVTLNPANIFGNGVDTTVTGLAAFVAHRDEGDVVGWGNGDHGATIPPTIITMDDIVEVSCTRSAYAARRVNGAVVAWGTKTEGADMTGVEQMNFVQVVGNSTAFAGLKNPGRMVAWGVENDGGDLPDNLRGLTDVTQIAGAGQAFAAVRANGTVVAWGHPDNGGTITSDIEGLNDIEHVIGSFGAFAAHRGNGRLVGWGHETYGSVVPPDIAEMTNIIELSCATAQAFAARRTTGQVVAWGTAAYGGEVDPLIEGLTDIVEVSSTWRAFAARRGNGHVVAWGTKDEGGNVPEDISAIDNIVQVIGSSMAFAALRKDGTVVAWGNATVGGDTSTVVTQLTNVRAIYANTHGFTALTSDGRVVTWGMPAGGGDSSAVQERLAGKVPYLATPASRGRALLASRWLMEH